jgi:hypothetical protein
LRGKTVAKLLLIMILLSAPSISPFDEVDASEVIEHLICGGVEPLSREPLGTGEIFFTHNVAAYYWFNMTGLTYGEAVRVDWYSPEGYLYSSETIYVEDPEIGVYWSHMDIDGDFPSTNPGVWTARLYISDEYIDSLEVEIIDYDLLVEGIQGLVSQIDDLSVDLSSLSQSYYSLQENYTTTVLELSSIQLNYYLLQLEHSNLQAEYDLLTGTYDILAQQYSNMTEAYQEFSETYGLIQADYLSTLNSLRQTRNMLYGVSVIAAILFITTVFFALIRRPRQPTRREEAPSREEALKEEVEETEEAEEEPEEDLFNKEGLNRLTKSDLKEILDEIGVGYRSKARKAELIELILEAQEPLRNENA